MRFSAWGYVRQGGAVAALISFALGSSYFANAQDSEPLSSSTKFSIEAIVQIGDGMTRHNAQCELNARCIFFQEGDVEMSVRRTLPDKRGDRLSVVISSRKDCCFFSGGDNHSVLPRTGGPGRFRADLFQGRPAYRLEYPLNRKAGTLFVIVQDPEGIPDAQDRVLKRL